MNKAFQFYEKYVDIKRTLNIIISSIYVVVYDYIVKVYLTDKFGYLIDYTYHDLSSFDFVSYIILGTFPIIFYKGFNYIAAIFSFFCYLLVYIPFLNTLFVAGYPEEIKTIYILLFFTTQCVFFLTDNIYLGKRKYNSKKIISFKQFELIVLILFLIIMCININKIHYVNIFSTDSRNLLYDLRAENNSSSGLFNSYVLTWLNHVLIPILMVCYLMRNQYIKVCLSFFAMIILFMIDMQKISFLIPFIIIIFFYLYKFHPKGYLENFHLFLLITLIILPLILISNLSNPIAFSIAAILIMRTQCVEGREFATYFNFFEANDNPYTYYTHINFIDKLTGLYPYDSSLGYVVSYGEGNSNANFFLMDGIAAGGVIGCIIAAIAFIIFKSYFNSIGNNFDKGLCIIILFFPISSLMNVSLFTSLLTGGFLIFYLICRNVDLSPIKINGKRSTKTKRDKLKEIVKFR